MNSFLKASAIGLITVAVSACGNNHHKSKVDIDGRAALGALLNATCTVTTLSGTVLGSGTTDGSGNFTMTLSPAPSEPYVLSCTGGQYFNEATGQFETFTGTMKAVAPSDTTSLAVTPLTDVAAEAVLALGGTVTDGQVDTVLGDIASFFGLGDLLALPQVVNSLDDLDTLSGNAGAYAAVLAALANLTEGMGLDAQDVLSLLADDIADGDLGDQFSQSEIDDEAASVAEGTDAADELASGQDDPDRNDGTITGSGGN
ncbi:hypothetical protein E4T66_06770 [Sinimarinibacterium sp. CAU 1509]|nr:hypothetical protein E4T66_06770 [Sinimarinibacterium sp. CAU 1509]